MISSGEDWKANILIKYTSKPRIIHIETLLLGEKNGSLMYAYVVLGTLSKFLNYEQAMDKIRVLEGVKKWQFNVCLCHEVKL